MTFQSALSAGNLTKLRSSSYACDYLLKLCSNRVVFAGQLNGAVADDWAQFTYNNVTVGAYTDVVVGQAFLIADTNDKTTARFRGRIRKTPTSTIIYSNESSLTFSSGAYFWVLDTFDAQYKLSRPDANGNELIDYDSAYEGLEPSVTGLQTAYFNYDPTGGKYRIAFNITAFAKQSGGTISSYQFTFKASTYTVISGALNTNAVTVDFDPGEQWGKLVVTDNAGVSKTRHFLIQACDDTINPPDTGFDAPPISCDLQRGWTLSVGAFAGVDSALNNTFVVVGRANEQFGGTSGGLFTDNIAFCGWLQRENNPAASDPMHGVIETVSFDFNGVAAALARLNSQLVPFFNSAAPSAWGYILNLTPWRAVAHYLDRYTTIGDLCDLAFDVHDDTFLFPTITTQGGNALSVIMGIAAEVDYVVEFAPDGKIQMVKDVTYQTSSERAADVTIAPLQTQDFINLTRAQEQNPNYGLTDTDGAYYNTANGNVVGFTARAPGIARGEAEGSDNLPAQILAAGTDDLTALAELIQRATNRFEFVNNNEYLDAEFVDGWNFLIPSRQQLYTVTASALTANGVNRISYDTSTQWVLESCTITRGDNGTTMPKGRFHKVQRIGTGGVNTTLVPPGETDFSIPDFAFALPAFDFQLPEVTIPDSGGSLPEPTLPGGVIADANGQTVAIKSNTQAGILTNFINLTVPKASIVTPSDLGNYRIKQILFDPFSPSDALGCYILASDGTNSAVWYTTNCQASPVIWTKGANVTGVYQTIRSTPVSGAVLIYGADTSSSQTTYDFTVSDQGFTAPTGLGTYVAATGWRTSLVNLTPTDAYRAVYITKNIGSTQTITALSLTFSRTFGTFNEGGALADDGLFPDAGPAPDANAFYQINSVNGSAGSNLTISGSGSHSSNTVAFQVMSGHNGVTGADPGGEVTVTKMVVTTSGGSNASVHYSTDNGATFGSALSMGSTPGAVGGYAVQRAGTNSFAAANGAVYRATTLGGAYSSYYSITGTPPQAACIVIPYYDWNGNKQTTATNPDILVGLTGADGSSRTLLWIEGGATPGTVHDLTPVASFFFSNPNAITTAYNHHIACFGTVSGFAKLYTTTTKGSAWANRGALTGPSFIRTRRGDTRAAVSGTNAGQLFLVQNNVVDYSSKWAGSGLFPRTMPFSGVDGIDIWSK